MATFSSRGVAIRVKEPRKPTVSIDSSNHGFVTITVDPNRLAQLNNNPSGTPTPTAATSMVGRSFVSDAATAGNSRAASADRTGDRVAMPTVAAAHGTPTRQYLNSSVTYHLLEGMKFIAQEQYVTMQTHAHTHTRAYISRVKDFDQTREILTEYGFSHNRPANPLRVLGEFLLERSKEYEGATNGTNGEAAGDESKETDKNGDE